MGLPNPSRETKNSQARTGTRNNSVQLADREQDWQPCPVVMIIHINKLYIHTAVVTHRYAYTAVNRARMYMPPNKKYTDTWYSIQTNTNSSTLPVHIYVLTTDTGVDHEQVWQPYAVDPSYSAISKWWPHLLALYINTDHQ